MNLRWIAAVAVLSFLAVAVARAAPFPVGPGAFSSSATVITYAGATDFVQPFDVGGTTFQGVLHEYFIDGQPDVRAIFSALPVPGMNPPLVLGNVWNAALSLTLPEPVYLFAFDFVLNIDATIPDAVSVRLFDPADVFLGELSFGAVIIPNFSGWAMKGFAGVGDAVPFTRVELRFNETLPTRWPDIPDPGSRVFAIDNLRFESAVPEPPTLALTFAAGMALAWRLGQTRYR